MLSTAGVDPLIVVPVLFTVLGVGFARTGFRIRRTAREFWAVARRAPGVVTDLRYRSAGRDASGGTWFPVLRFVTADGRQIDTEAMYGRSPAPARRGDEVTVLYDPDDPTQATLGGRSGGRLLGTVFIVMGLLFAAIGLMFGGVAVVVTLL